MHSHHITSALAGARTAELHRLASRPAAPRRHRRALAVLGVATTVVLAALAPSGASARPIHDAAVAVRAQTEPTAAPAQDLRLPDVRDLAAGRGTFNSPQVVVVKAPAPPTRPALAGGIGAGGLLALGLIALGGALLITHHRRTAHDAPHAGL